LLYALRRLSARRGTLYRLLIFQTPSARHCPGYCKTSGGGVEVLGEAILVDGFLVRFLRRNPFLGDQILNPIIQGLHADVLPGLHGSSDLKCFGVLNEIADGHLPCAAACLVHRMRGANNAAGSQENCGLKEYR
jgi:hypothetical protein